MTSIKKLANLTPAALLTVIALITLTLSTLAAAQTENILYTFPLDAAHGLLPNGGLIFDAAGNFYGTTQQGGTATCNCGTVFELSPLAGGGWKQTVLHSFHLNSTGGITDGQYPLAGVVFDPAGNLYGTTSRGGKYGYGTVFKLTPKTGGGWTEKTVHSFNADGKDGYTPSSGLVVDPAGNLYGTTLYGGFFGVANLPAGVVYELQRTPSGLVEKILHSFDIHHKSGASPTGNLIRDAAGNLYGTATAGGVSGSGTVFRLTPTTAGEWPETVLYDINSNNEGRIPGGLTLDAKGNFFVQLQSGGANNSGAVAELVPSSGTYTEQTVYAFCSQSSCTDGSAPQGPIVLDSAGDLYGATGGGGSAGWGEVFKLTPGGGSWTESVLYSFQGSGSDPCIPTGIVLGSSGHLFGTTAGAQQCRRLDVVFEITP